jgi:hypothetical protein
MSNHDLSPQQIRAALAHLGSLLPPAPMAEMVIIGGAAGVLSGALPASRTTVDCDVLQVFPPEIFDLCRYHAEEVAQRFQIAPQWLDASAHALTHLMLPGWRDRLVTIDTFGSLKVRAVGRLDLIALKVIAGRAEDLEDLDSLTITHAEAEQLLELFPAIQARGISPQTYAAALEVLSIMRPKNES